MLRYLKEPVEYINELYNRYPDGGERGWFALVLSEDRFAMWDTAQKEWVYVKGEKQLQVDWNEENPDSITYILNKPDLDEVGKAFVKYDKNDILETGSFYLHPKRDMMYEGNIEKDTELSESDFSETYGTLFLLLTNPTDSSLTLTLPEEYAYLPNETNKMQFLPGEQKEIAVKSYGSVRVVTSISSIPLKIENTDWEEEDPDSQAYIKNKPNLDEVGKAFIKYDGADIVSTGTFYLHPKREMMYEADITNNVTIEEIDAQETYGTLYLVLNNTSNNPITISLPRLTNYFYFPEDDNVYELEAHKTIEIAIKSYGTNRKVTRIYDYPDYIVQLERRVAITTDADMQILPVAEELELYKINTKNISRLRVKANIEGDDNWIDIPVSQTNSEIVPTYIDFTPYIPTDAIFEITRRTLTPNATMYLFFRTAPL